MATDQSPERNEIIFGVALMTALTLVVLHFVFNSYFDATTMMERKAKIAPREPLHQLRAEAESKLRSGAMPIEQAMAQLARGRMAALAIAPAPSDDLGALEGWNRLPNAARVKAAQQAMDLAEAAEGTAPTTAPEDTDGPAATEGEIAPGGPEPGSASAESEPALPSPTAQPNPRTPSPGSNPSPAGTPRPATDDPEPDGTGSR